MEFRRVLFRSSKYWRVFLSLTYEPHRPTYRNSDPPAIQAHREGGRVVEPFRDQSAHRLSRCEGAYGSRCADWLRGGNGLFHCRRSEERREGKECVSTCGSRGWP